MEVKSNVNRVFSYRLLSVPFDATELLDPTSKLLISVSKNSSWQNECQPEAISPRLEAIPEILGYVAVNIVKEVRKVVQPIEGEEHLEVDGNYYLTSGTGGANHIYVASKVFEHNQIGSGSFRVVGLHKNVTLTDGVAWGKNIYKPHEVNSSEWVYAESLEPTYIQRNLKQELKIVIKADTVLPGPVVHGPVSLTLDPPVWLAFREFELDVTAITDGHTVQWQQTKGPTVIISEPTKFTTHIERPNINDDPYKIKATVQKLWADDQVTVGVEELLIYTTPASELIVKTRHDSWIPVHILQLTYWYLPFEEDSSIQFLSNGDAAVINWSVSGTFNSGDLVSFEWQQKVGEDWNILETTPNTEGRVFNLPIDEEIRSICYFTEAGITTTQETYSIRSTPKVGLLQDTPVVKSGSRANWVSSGEVTYTPAIYQDNLTTHTASSSSVQSIEIRVSLFNNEDELRIKIGKAKTNITYIDYGLSVGGI